MVQLALTVRSTSTVAGKGSTGSGSSDSLSPSSPTERPPGRAGQIGPVPLLLGTWRMVDVDRLAALNAGAGLTVRPQPPTAQRAGEARVAARVAERLDLLVQGGRPHVAVLGQPRRRVVGERGERIGPRRAALARGAVPIEVGTDRLGVTAKMAGDRCDRPALRAERCCLHVFLPCEHGPGLPDAAASHTASIREPHPLWWTLPPPPGSKWGVQ